MIRPEIQDAVDKTVAVIVEGVRKTSQTLAGAPGETADLVAWSIAQNVVIEIERSMEQKTRYILEGIKATGEGKK